MKQYKWTREAILDKTNGGLDIITRLYPDSDNGGSGKFPHFMTHEEGHGSSIIFKKSDNDYIIKNFGGGDDMSPFDAIIEKTPAADFYEALQWAVSEFNLGDGNRFGQAELEIIPATKGQKDGQYYFDYKPKLTELDLETLGPLVTAKGVLKFNLKSCNHFIQVKQYRNHKKFGDKLMQIITRATETYPILVFDMGTWQKIYQPLNKDKGYRFRYAGDKPKNYLFGKDLIADEYEPLDDSINEHDTDVYDVENDPRAPVIIIASGDRDALNTDSLDYPVVWKNSESEPLHYDDYLFLKAHSGKLCYLGDLDPAGVRATIDIALNFIDISIIHLPAWLLERTYRGKSQKDMTDFCKAVHSFGGESALDFQFQNLVKDALPARFWDHKYKKDGKFNGYEFNNEACYRFLQYNGYYRFREKHAKDPFSYINLGQNVVRRVEIDEVANFPGNYVREKRKGNIPLLNYIHRSPQLSDKKLSQLQIEDPDFDGTTGADMQYLFFENEIWQITPEAITKHKYGSIEDLNIWDERIIKRSPQLINDKIFTITKKDGDYDIDLHKTDNHFLNFLIETSRIHWRFLGDKPYKEREAAAKLSINDPIEREAAIKKIWAQRDDYREKNRFNIAEEGLPDNMVARQKLNLINKIFSFGFGVHRYKLGSRAWSGFAMDDKISDVGDSNGGSGKSIVWHKALREILPNYKYVNGGDPDIAKDKFLYDGVDHDTDCVIFDDLDTMFPIRKVYNNITGEFNINPKFGKPFSLPYDKSPKVFFTSNFGIYKSDASTMRRLLITVFADYYHHTNDDDKDSWTFRDQMGFDLFTNFDDKMWSDFFSFCAQACQFQMTVNEKIDPPMENVHKRNSLQRMGDAFKDWADNFFENRKNILVVKSDAMESLKANGLGKYTSQKFKKNLHEWCKHYDHILNPEGVHNSQGYVKHSIDNKTQECVYIQEVLPSGVPKMVTLNKSSGELDSGTVDMDDLADDDKDDLPF